MLTEVPKSIASVEPGVPSLIQDKWYIKFSDAWDPARTNVTGTNPVTKTTYGKFFQVVERNQVAYDIPYIIPANDYRDVDFSDSQTIPGIQENLYPRQDQTLYELLLGWKFANFLAQFYVPAGQVFSRLEQPAMIAPDPPTVTAGNFLDPRRYLGQKKYEDSPYHDKKIYLYTIKDMDAVIMRLFVDSGLPAIATDYEKIVMGLIINKLKLANIVMQFDSVGNVTYPDAKMLERARTISYYTEQRW